MTDQQIIASIRKGNNEKPIRELYKEFPKIKNLIVSSGGNELIAEEVFNDSLVLLIEKVKNNEFELSAKLSTYLYGINRFLFKNELRKQQKNEFNLEWKDTLILSEEDFRYDAEKERQLVLMEKILEEISEKCKQLFNLFYFQKMSMTQIAKKLNYTSVNSAKTQKYKCIERASKMAEEMLNTNPLN